MSFPQASWNKKAVGLNPSSQVQYIDHLAVVCILMGIPLLFLEESDLELAKKYYPQLDAALCPYQYFSPEYLIANYDLSFMSDMFDRRTMHAKFSELEKQYHKRWRNVHCPHGFSDKGFYIKKCCMEDITLIYGDNMIDQLKYHEVWQHVQSYVITGNYRYTYFKQHQQFFDSVFERDIQSRFDKPRPLILYAPTWMDLEESSSFFEAYEGILGNLPDHYNLLVKLHTRLELDDVVKYYQIIGQYENRSNIVFLKEYPLVFPLLAKADIYIGDMSSVGYDFLAFNKAMFFINKQQRSAATDRGLYLFRCGTEIQPDRYDQIYSIIEKSLPLDQEHFSAIRQQVWDYTFGKERAFADIRSDIIKAVRQT